MCMKCGDYYSGSAAEVTPEMRAGHCSWCSHERGAKYHESSHSHRRINHTPSSREYYEKSSQASLLCAVGKINIDVQQLCENGH